MKKSLVALAIIFLIVVGCFTTLFACSNQGDEANIEYNDEILSRYGDAFIDTATIAAPSTAVEYINENRVTRKFLIDTRIKGRHVLGLYMPLLEEVTFEVDSSEIGKHHKIAINANCSTTETPWTFELDATKIEKHRTLSGGMIEIDVADTNTDTFILTVSGCMPLSSYRYGIDDKAEFDNKGNYNLLDCMNFRIYVPASEYKKINDAEKVMNWWRNALLSIDKVLNLSIFAEDYSPMCLYFKNGLNTDEYFDSTNNCLYLPYDYISTIVDYDYLTNDPEGMLLEVLDYIVREKILLSHAFDGTFLSSAIDEILSRLTYINMVDSFSANMYDNNKRYTYAGNVEQILEGNYEDDVERYSALFVRAFYTMPSDAIYSALISVSRDNLSDSKLVAKLAKDTNQDLRNLSEKLNISLYGGDREEMKEYNPHYIVASKYALGQRQYPAQLGITVKLGENAKFDFASSIVGEGEWQVSDISGSENRWSKDENGIYTYSPNQKKLRDNFTITLDNGTNHVELYGNIAVDITVCENVIYDDVTFTKLDEAMKGAKDMNPTEIVALDYAGIEKEAIEGGDKKRYVEASGAIEVEETGDYYLYLKSSGLCSVKFGVKDYFTEIFNNSLTVGTYTSELEYKVKLEKGYTYDFTIYNLFNRGAGFATLGIKAPGKEIQDIDKSYLVNQKLNRSNIVEYTNAQEYANLYSVQSEEYMPIKVEEIAQIVNLDEYKIGEESALLPAGSIASFVVPFEEMSLVDYLKIETQNMNNTLVKLYGGTGYTQELTYAYISGKETTLLFDQRNLDSIKVEFKCVSEYRLHVTNIEVGKSISSMTIIPSTSTKIEYIGAWSSSKNYIALNGRLAISNAKDAIFSYAFNGNEISIYATIGPEFGTAKVTIDGQEKESIDLNNSKVLCSQLVYTARISDGDHVIRISPADETPINIDYLAVTAFGETKTKNDFSKLWYVSIIPGLLLIAGIVFAVLDYKEKKKKKEQQSAD